MAGCCVAPRPVRDNPRVLVDCSTPLAEAYDTAVLDLDGVVYIGGDAVPGAAEALAAAEDRGMHLAFITNNAARTPATVAAHLRRLGVRVRDDGEVVTSAQAAARLVAERVPAGSAVYLIGGEGLEVALHELGLRPVTDPADDPVAVVQGYGPDMPWRQVVQGAILVREGLPWVASNMDMTIPTATGIGPGNGTLVELVARYADRKPEVAGKPARALFDETALRVGGERPLVVGDRLDTDIEGARAVGWDSLLVMTGVSDLVEVVSAPAHQRPSFVGADLSALLAPAPVPEQMDRTWRCDGWQAFVRDGRLEVTGTGEDVDAWWRLVACAGWEYLDEHGSAVDVSGLTPPGSVAP